MNTLLCEQVFCVCYATITTPGVASVVQVIYCLVRQLSKKRQLTTSIKLKTFETIFILHLSMRSSCIVTVVFSTVKFSFFYIRINSAPVFNLHQTDSFALSKAKKKLTFIMHIVYLTPTTLILNRPTLGARTRYTQRRYVLSLRN
jgi:hypothetical protein